MLLVSWFGAVPAVPNSFTSWRSAAAAWPADRRTRTTVGTASSGPRQLTRILIPQWTTSANSLLAIMSSAAGFDVVIGGASIAGCAAARLFARAGARVALVERRPDPSAYKVACTHQIQSSAAPAIERLGLAPLLEDAGAVRSRAAGWSPYGGWLRFPSDAPLGYGITRR